MRLIKHHPVLATLIALVFLGVAAPLTYAAIEHVFITVDASESAPEIQQDVQAQLQQQHVTAEVQVAKPDDNHLQVMIKATDPQSAPPDLQVAVHGGSDAEQIHMGVQLQVSCELTGDQQTQLTSVVPGAVSLVSERPAGQSDADLIAAITALFATAGFHDVQIALADGQLTVSVTAPPR